MVALLIIAAIIVMVLILLAVNRIHIEWRSIFAKTLPLDTGVFGVYCFTGHQGSGKTYGLNKYIRKHAAGREIYSNITLKGIDYTPITSLQQLYSLADKERIIIIYDEIFTLMSKSKKDRAMLEQFLPQMRKVKNIFLTTAQYWLELDITFRRFVRVQVECRTRPLGRYGGIFIEEYNDTTEIKWSQIENEYISPRIAKKYSKYERKYMESYDTYERVKGLDGLTASAAPSGAGVRSKPIRVN